MAAHVPVIGDLSLLAPRKSPSFTNLQNQSATTGTMFLAEGALALLLIRLFLFSCFGYLSINFIDVCWNESSMNVLHM